MATVEKAKEKAWIDTRALALSKIVGIHKHPTLPGFFMRVNPKKGAVFGYRFRDAFGAVQSDTLGPYKLLTDGDGISLEDAVKEFERIRTFHKTKSTVGRLTLAQAIARWFEQSKKRGGKDKSPRTKEYYSELYTRYLKATAENWVLEQVTPSQWQSLLETARAKSPNQARGAYWMLHGIYRFFISLKILADNPLSNDILRAQFSGDDTKKVRKSHVQALDLPKLMKGLQEIKNEQAHRAITVLLLTGWRLAAVLRLRWDRIDFEAGTYEVRPFDAGWKGYEGLVAISFYVLRILEEYRDAGGEKISPYVFPARHGGNEYMVDVRGSMKIACKYLGYHITPHDLRRTFATVGEVMLDGNIRLLGLLMAHKPQEGSNTTYSYVVRNYQAERKSAGTVVEAIYEIGDIFPMDERTLAKFAERGIDVSNITLVDLEDD